MEKTAKVSISELRRALLQCRNGLIGVAIFSALVNILMLTGPIFMLQVYDRVLPSRSIQTLAALAIIVTGVFFFQGIVDILRQRILNRIAGVFDESVTGRMHEAIVRLPFRRGLSDDGLQPYRDLDQIRGFLSSSGPSAFFDLPWTPFYVLICYIFHPWIGFAAAIGVMLVLVITLMTEFLSRSPARHAATSAAVRALHVQSIRRNAEAVHAMGIAENLKQKWLEKNSLYLQSQKRATDVIAGLGGLARTVRYLLQSLVLGLGAYLVIEQQLTAGIIIASSILVSRALAPIELSVANWKGFVAARQSWGRLGETLRAIPTAPPVLILPTPSERLSVENVSVLPPGAQRVVVQDVSFRLQAGEGLGIIGPSGSGKSSLARALVGIWQPLRGQVRLDGASLDQWHPDRLGCSVGYIPQEPSLFEGTIAENICRFEPEFVPEAVIAAAKAADVHDLILTFADGYEMRIGESGSALSAGQRQRIALARALYKNPFLIVLDEPNSNLDESGDHALTTAIAGARARGAIVIVIAHRPSALLAIDQLLVLANGRQVAFGMKDDVLRDMRAAATLKVVTN